MTDLGNIIILLLSLNGVVGLSVLVLCLSIYEHIKGGDKRGETDSQGQADDDADNG